MKDIAMRAVLKQNPDQQSAHNATDCLQNGRGTEGGCQGTKIDQKPHAEEQGERRQGRQFKPSVLKEPDTAGVWPLRYGTSVSPTPANPELSPTSRLRVHV